MVRRILSVMLAALLVLTGSGAALASPDVGNQITLMGRLEYVTSPATPHYEVDGYVLLNKDPSPMEKLAGQDVVVVGVPSNEPSIYMRKTLVVESITTKAAYTPPIKSPDPVAPPAVNPTIPQPTIPAPIDKIPAPVKPTPAPVPAPWPPKPAIRPIDPPNQPDQPAPAPAVPNLPVPPADGGKVIAEPEPIHLFGSPYYVVFGQVVTKDGTYLLMQDTATGTVTDELCSTTVDLAALVGQHVGLIVARDTGKDLCYRVVAAVVLTADRAPAVSKGTDPIYAAPAHPITILLHGQALVTDQAPLVGNGRTLVPLRAIGEALGAAVTWDQATGTATVALGNREVQVTLGSNKVVIHEAGQPDAVLYADIAPVVDNGRTLVPVRVISEGLGLKVGWDSATSTVTLD